jgi:protein SCO1/2
MVLTPQGRISKYFYGIEYKPRDLRLGLVEASQDKIGTLADQVLLFCFHYDPMTGKYGPIIANVTRILASATILGLGALIFILSRRSKRDDGVGSGRLA